jgi:hypothetical protein
LSFFQKLNSPARNSRSLLASSSGARLIRRRVYLGLVGIGALRRQEGVGLFEQVVEGKLVRDVDRHNLLVSRWDTRKRLTTHRASARRRYLAPSPERDKVEMAHLVAFVNDEFTNAVTRRADIDDLAASVIA